jgi:outer membrane protein OmpA-like peptidoglycan-associated protein
MKKYFLYSVSFLFICRAEAQTLKKIAERVKQRTENKTNEKVDTKVDQTVDTAFSKTEKAISDAAKGNNKEKTTNPSDNSGSDGNNEKSTGGQQSFKTYSKYDFVPGERIIWYEDFAEDAIGDLPDKWNTNGAGETVTIDGINGHWFMLTQKGFYMPDGVDSLPENFTLEYDLMIDQPVHSWGIFTALAELQDRNKPENWQSSNNTFALNILPGGEGNGTCSYNRRKAGTGEAAINTQITYFKDFTKPVHVAFWRQKERLRVYINEDKVWDVPKAIIPEAKLNSLIFWIQLTDGKWHFLLNNLRLAVGAPDTRKKILEQNKWVTHGILFDVNSDKIKPESYGTLKEMAIVLKEYNDLNVKIVGHTDADGKDDANLDLSKRRAASVKAALAKEFGIDESRMETDGKGESEPIDKNDTPAGKANNRRVEFIKI